MHIGLSSPTLFIFFILFYFIFFEELILIIPLCSFNCLHLTYGKTILDVVSKNKQK